MSSSRHIRLLSSVCVAGLGLLSSAAMAAANDASCPAASGTLPVGQAVRVEPGPARGFGIELAQGQGVIVDLSSLVAPSKKDAAEADEDESDHDAVKALPRDVVICGASGALLAPQPGEVFEKGGSLSATSDGQRLRFVAPAAGRYTIRIAPSGTPREVLLRNRDLGKAGGVVPTRIGASVTGSVSSSAPVTYSFAGTAGQWVEIKATSESDTLLHLAAPERGGGYRQVASNDDADGLNPRLRRLLPVTGTYYVQVDSLADAADSFTLSIRPTQAPPPPPPPAMLRSGVEVTGKLADGDDVRLYAANLVAGHAYRLELNAAYDGVVAVGLPNPIETDDSKEGPAGSFSEIKSQDSGTSGTERLNFSARSSGPVTVMVKSFGIGETDGAYTLVLTDLGG